MTAAVDPLFSDDDEKAFSKAEDEQAAYTSPVLARLQGSGKLTLESLAADVPLLKAGQVANLRLQDPEAVLTADERDELERTVREGEYAKERLVFSGIPLVKYLAKKEHQRRQNWQSRITYEELIQEGISGLLRGLTAYKPEGKQTSPTNYLGQWIMVEMRRQVETYDNDISVSYEASEKFRKIRAIRSRLIAELNREPSDDEILEAANDPTHRGGRKIGRVNKTGAPPKRGLTAKNLADEREYRNRVGYTARYTTSTTDDGTYEGPHVESGAGIYEDYAPADQDAVIENAAKDGLARLFAETIVLMNLPPMQRDLVARRFGIPPHLVEQTAREIASTLGVKPDTVNKVLDAFQTEMTRPGGAFHQACSVLDPDDLEAMGVGWARQVLGEWDEVPAPVRAQTPPSILTESLPMIGGKIAPPAEQPPSRLGETVRAQFECDYHGWGFVGVYPQRDDVPPQRACPQCGRASGLVRVMVA